MYKVKQIEFPKGLNEKDSLIHLKKLYIKKIVVIYYVPHAKEYFLFYLFQCFLKVSSIEGFKPS